MTHSTRGGVSRVRLLQHLIRYRMFAVCPSE